MKAIRRSLKGDKESKPHHISVTPKSAFAIEPPKKVIKALYDYTPEPGTPHELAFAKGDFFHVIGREDDPDWYDACNPLIPSARGLVPVTFFEVIGKNERSSAGSAHGQNPYGFPATGGSDYGHHQHLHNLHDSGYAGVGSGLGTGIAGGGSSSNSCSSMARGGAALIYGIVLYDFSAERPDELEATAGEAIIVIAVSNPEWFVAKPIGRLGGPGLIPVSFIEIRDMSSGAIVTDPADAVRRAGVPRVEEWKKMTADYKNSSITLGKFEQQQQHQQQQQQQRAHQQQQLLLQQQQQHKKQRLEQQLEQRYQAERLASDMDRLSVGSPTSSAALAPVRASIPRYCFDQDRYWYIIEAEMEDGRHWELSRFYEDFYNFQIGLLREFEEEAGNRSKPRTLPFMPGPVNTVTDAISNGRRQNLDEYIRKVIAMPPHISRSQLVRQLFAPRPGDFEIDPTVTADDFGGSGGGTDRRSYESTGSYRGGDGHYRGLSGSSQSAGIAAAVPVIPPIARQPAAPAPMMPAYVSPPAAAAARPVVGGGGSGGSGGVAPLPPPASSTPTPPIKIKVYYRDDLIALRVPADTTFAALVQKVRERLHVDDASGGDRLVLRYRDEPSGGQLVLLGSDTDLDEALRRNAKLGLYVGFE